MTMVTAITTWEKASNSEYSGQPAPTSHPAEYSGPIFENAAMAASAPPWKLWMIEGQKKAGQPYRGKVRRSRPAQIAFIRLIS